MSNSGNTEPNVSKASEDVIRTSKKHSSDIITVATNLRQSGIKNTVMKYEQQKAQDKAASRGCCGNSSAQDDKIELQKLKGELEMDDHERPIGELLKSFGLDEQSAPLIKEFDEEGKEVWSVDTAEIKGLSADQVLRAREIYGANQLSPPKKIPEIIILLGHLFGDFFSLLLWGGALLCLIGYTLKRENDNLYLCIVLAGVVTITGVFGYFQEKKSSDLMESFKNMMPQNTQVIRCDESGNAELQEIDAKFLVPGDIIKIKYGDKVPADIRVIECSDSFHVDNSSLTGESEPQIRTTKCTDPNPLETKNLCFFGTECPEGLAHGLVIRTGDTTVMGRIARLTSSLKDDTLSPIKKEVNLFVKLISAVAIILGVGFFFVGIGLQTDIITNLVFMIGIIVANVPEGLILTVLVCLSLTAQRMYNSSVLVKDLEGVETLGSTTCICSDKTGTLTQNIMTVQKVCYDHQTYQAMKSGDVEAKPNPNNSDTFEAFLRCAIVCNTAVFVEDSKFGKKLDEQGIKVRDITKPIDFDREVLVGGQTERRVQWKTNGDATESALIKFAQKSVDVDDYRSRFKEVTKMPFNSKNKFMVVISKFPGNMQREADDAEFLLTMKGAPERVINRCSHVMIDGKVQEMSPKHRAKIETLQTKCSTAGLRVLGFAELSLPRSDYPADYKFATDNPNFPIGADLSTWTNINMEPHPRSADKLVFLGLYALIDPPRPQVRPAVAKCKTAGIRVIMVTGDHPITAKAIARQVGIIWGDAKRGGDIDGPATQEDYETWNNERGLSRANRVNEDGDQWFDPRLAPAIVVPGWEIIADDCHLNQKEPFRNEDTDVTEVPKEKWDDILAHTQIVFARTSPQQKLIIVENCKKRGEIVAVTGDGVNDAPALRKAHIGIAMGIMGSDVSQEAADMILLDDNFASIVQGVEEGRLIFDNLKKSIAYTLSSNIPEIAPFLIYITAKMPLPLSTVLILFVDLGTDMIPAISMAWENAESDIMRRPPRNADRDHLVTKKLIFFSYLQIGVIQALAGFFTYIVVLGDYGFPAHILPGSGQLDMWGKQTLWCQTTGGMWVNQDFDPTIYAKHHQTDRTVEKWDPQHPIWWEGPAESRGNVEKCTFASKDIRGNADSHDKANSLNTECYEVYASAVSGEKIALELFEPEYFWWWDTIGNYPQKPSVEDCWDSAKPYSYYNNDGVLWTAGKWVSSYQAQLVLYKEGYRPFVPFKSRTSVFFSSQWMMTDIYGSEVGSTNQVYGFGMPVFRKKYAKYLQDSGKTPQYHDWNVNLDTSWAETGPLIVNPVVFYNYQAVGKYDISAFGDNVGDIWFPTTDIAESEDIFGNRVPAYDSNFGNPLNPQQIPDMYGYQSAANTKAIYKKRCEAAPNNPFHSCKTVGDRGFGNANFTFPAMDYNYDENRIFPSFNTTADFRSQCKSTAHVDGGAWSWFIPSSMCDENEAGLKFNVLSRMVQYEALAHAQTAYFVAIVIVQWADLMICKTRMNSIAHQGMLNGFMNFGLVFETLLAAILCYIPFVNSGLSTRPIRATHWLPAVPFSLWIFGYDEIRKWIMRTTTKTTENSLTGQVERDPQWMERNTYY